MTGACATMKTERKLTKPFPIAARFVLLIALAGGLLSLGLPKAAGQQLSRKPFGDSLSRYHSERKRTYHLEHIVLRVTLDEKNKSVSGTSELTVRPLSEALDTLDVDSAELKILSATEPDGTKLPFDQIEQKLRIHLPAPAGPNDEITVTIAFSGNPRKGLYFIAPDRSYPDKPVQIWSQGEVDDSHFWFPVYDYPNDRATSEGYYTVNADYTVISNGRLIGVEEHPETHTKTYHWKQEIPHSTYLTSVVVGKFEKYTDQLGQLPVEYYVPPGTGRDTTMRSFRETPAAIRFYAEKIGIPYPYPKYAQVAVHDFIFGGMENISATTLTDRTLHDEASEPQSDSVDLVTHELAHQWFGDLLTCADWAHIWLNEGFATFWSDVYREHRFGEQDYRYSLYQQANRYLEEDRQRYRRPMVDAYYTDPLDLFDRTTYEKGALVLDMLRYILGDEKFFAAINHYAQANREKTVVTDDLRKAMEESTGEDLKWFFDEWTAKAGYPEFEISQQWDERSKVLHLEIAQKQTLDELTPLFRMPADVELTTQAGRVQKRIQISRAREQFDFPLDGKPLMVRFDPDHRLLDTVKFPKTTSELIYQLEHDASVTGQVWASQQLAQEENEPKEEIPEIVSALRNVLHGNTFWGVRQAAAESLAKIRTEKARDALAEALRDGDGRVRQAAVRALGAFDKDARAAKLVRNVYASDRDPIVAAEAALSIARMHAKGAREFLLQALRRDSNQDVIRRYALRGVGDLGDSQDWELVASWTEYGRPQETRLAAIRSILKLGGEQDERTAMKLIALLNDPDFFVKEQVISALGEGNFQQARAALGKVAQTEPDSRVRRSARIALERLAASSPGDSQVFGRPLPPSGLPAAASRNAVAAFR